MTFPMRGDGGTAKEISTPTLSLSSVSEVPAHIPYPGVIPSAESRTSSESGSRTPVTAGASAGGNFFSGLTRRNSKRGETASGGLLPLTKQGIGNAVRAAGGRGHAVTPSVPDLGISSNSDPLDPRREQVRHHASADVAPTLRDTNTARQRGATVAVAGPRVPGGPRSASPPKSMAIPSAYITREPATISSPITDMSPPSAAGAMYSGFTTQPSGTGVSHRTPGAPSLAASSSPRDGASTRAGNGSLPASNYAAGGQSGRPGARSSLSYGSVRERDRLGEANGGGGAAFEEAVDKMSDVLPDADRDILCGYLRKCGGDDLAAISAYLQDQGTKRR